MKSKIAGMELGFTPLVFDNLKMVQKSTTVKSQNSVLVCAMESVIIFLNHASVRLPNLNVRKGKLGKNIGYETWNEF